MTIWNHQTLVLFAFCVLVSATTVVAQTSEDDQQPVAGVKFIPTLLMIDANEGIDIADVNNDGSLDIVAGRNWYAAPEFKPRPLRNIDDWNGYVESNGDQTYDVDGDGWVDVVAGSFRPSEIYWYRNPGSEGLKLGQLWKPNLLVDTKFSQNEMCFLRDIDGDGKPEWIFNSWNKQNPVIVWSFAKEPASPSDSKPKTNQKANQKTNQKKQPKKNQGTPKSSSRYVLKQHVIGTETHGHGMGFGDINNDGHEDVLVSTGWYERPAKNPLTSGPWKFHADWSLPHASCPMIVRDLNADGKNDLVWGHGHGYGLHWWELDGTDEEGKLQFKPHLIDDRYSQAHTIHFADLDGDKQDELITGKRVRGHNGKDPGGKEFACMYYYRWNPEKLEFQRFTIDEGHIGTGLQIRSADIDGDGDIDLAVAGKEGTWLLENQSKTKQ
ncbi:MAG: VCBS repeat-containing protein [Planctomycetota bacterium]